MTDPTENEDIELSTDELKSVSGGLVVDGLDRIHSSLSVDNTRITVDDGASASIHIIPPGTGSGMTRDDYRKANRLVSPDDRADPGTKTPTFI